MVRQHGSLEKDEETNQAAWEAARGALVGGTKVRDGSRADYIYYILAFSLLRI